MYKVPLSGRQKNQLKSLLLLYSAFSRLHIVSLNRKEKKLGLQFAYECFFFSITLFTLKCKNADYN